MNYIKFCDGLERHNGGAFSRFVLRMWRQEPELARNRPGRFPIGKIYPHALERSTYVKLLKYFGKMAREALEDAFEDGEKILDGAEELELLKSPESARAAKDGAPASVGVGVGVGTFREKQDGGAEFHDLLKFDVTAGGLVEDGAKKSGPLGELLESLEKIAADVCNHAEAIFAEWSEMTVGKPFYPETKTAAIRRDWVNNFQILCESANTETKAFIAREIWTAKQQGQNKREIYTAVENQYRAEIAKAKKAPFPKKYSEAEIKKELKKRQEKELSKAYEKLKADIEKGLGERIQHKAELVARTEIGKLNQAATRATHEAAGIDYYQWITTIDGRERESHAKLNGLICSHGDPSAQYIENEDNPENPTRENRPAGAYEGEPGEDFQCRCSCVPWIPVLNSKYRALILEKIERG